MRQQPHIPNCNSVLALIAALVLVILLSVTWFVQSYSNLESVVKNLETELSKSKAKHSLMQNKLELSHLAAKSMSRSKEQSNLELQKQKQRIQELKRALQLATNDLQNLKEELALSKFQNQGQSQEKQNEVLKNQLLMTEQQAQITQLEKQLSYFSKIQTEKTTEIEQWQNEVKKLRQELSHTDIKISQLKNRFTVFEMNQNILFQKGEIRLTPSGKTTLASLAKVFNQYPERQIAIQGHTDNLKLGDDLKRKYASNWELAAARAASAIYFLQNHENIDAKRMILVSYGQYRPKMLKKTAQARAQNRRIEIILMPKDFDFFRESGNSQ